MSRDENRERLNIVVAGHVDHGKSTVIGRLLADTGSLPRGKLEQIREFCARNSKPFEYAFLLDALKDEQAQGITIDAARIFFKTALRDYLIIDAPGHIEFLKNMISGASHASAALLVIDAKEGVRENSRRHATMLALLGIRQIAVLVNKLDLVGHDEESFGRIVSEYKACLRELGLAGFAFIPVSGLHGENIARRGESMPWYAGKTVVETLDLFLPEPPPEGKSFRMPVQDVYKFTSAGDERRIIAGTVVSGSLKAGDELVFYPSGKTGTVKSLEGFPAPPAGPVPAGRAAGFTLTEQVFVRRGELAALARQARPQVSRRFQASVFWLGKEPLKPGRDYTLKLGTARVAATLERVLRVLDAASLAARADAREVQRHEVADCVFSAESPLAFDPAEENHLTGRFVLVDGYEISGGGLVRKALGDAVSELREKAALRRLKWQRGLVTPQERERSLGQRAALLLVTGSDDELRKETAKLIEKKLFAEGRHAYFLGIGSVLYGLDADIRGAAFGHEEDIRRLAELAHILLDAGLILIVTADELTQSDLDRVKAALDPSRIACVWVGNAPSTDLNPDAVISAPSPALAADAALAFLRARGLLTIPSPPEGGKGRE